MNNYEKHLRDKYDAKIAAFVAEHEGCSEYNMDRDWWIYLPGITQRTNIRCKLERGVMRYYTEEYYLKYNINPPYLREVK